MQPTPVELVDIERHLGNKAPASWNQTQPLNIHTLHRVKIIGILVDQTK